MKLKKNKRKKLCLFFLCLAFITNGQTFSSILSKPDLKNPYNLVFKAIKNNSLDKLQKQLENYLKNLPFDKAKLQGAKQLTANYSLIQTIKKLKLDVKNKKENRLFLEWLAHDDTYFKIEVNLEPQDNRLKVFRVAKELVLFNPKDANKYANLICAIALVRDKNPKKMHRQMGINLVPYEKNNKLYYDYFRKLYNSRKNKIAYHKLSIRELVFVVGGAMSIKEFEWARENIKEKNPKKWDKKYAEIVYDDDRIATGQYDWLSNIYSLENIKKEGGICVDQAYYGVVTARAWGIPTMYFSGFGKRGAHAWFGFCVDGQKWDLNAGRYSYDKYTTGEGYNPQLQVKMKDHQMKLFLGYEGDANKRKIACDVFIISKVLAKLANYKVAEKFLKYSFSQYPNYAKNWDLILALNKDKSEKNITILKTKMGAYRRYPDMYIEVADQLITTYLKLKKTKEAQSVESSIKSIVRKRDDLSIRVSYLKAQRMYENNLRTYARSGYERALKKFLKKEKEKIFYPILDYLKLSNKYGESKEALEFTKKIASDVGNVEIGSLLLRYASWYTSHPYKRK